MGFQTTTIGASQTVGPAVFTLLGGAVSYQTAIVGASGGAALCTASLTLVPFDG